MKDITRMINNKLFKQALNSAEKEIFLAAYTYTGHNQVQTAKLLGVARGTLINRLKEWKIPQKNEQLDRDATI